MKEKIYRIIPWMVLAAAMLFTVGMYALYGAHNLDSDISSEMVLADLLNEEGKLITENWQYSTELRVVSPVPVYQLGLRLFPDDWHAARTFSVAVLMAGVAASLIYMARGAGFHVAGVLCAAAVILPIGKVQSFIFSFGGFYTMYVIVGGVLIGLVLRMSRRKGRALRLTALAVLSLIAGLSGVRMPMICGVPLMLACALEMFLALTESKSLRAALRSPQAAVTAGALLSIALMMAGYVINARVLSQKYTFVGYEQTTMNGLDLSQMLTQLVMLVQFFGYKANVPLMSLEGVGNVLAIGVFGLMVVSALWWLRRRERTTVQGRVLVYFAVMAVAFGVLLNVTTGRAGNEYGVGYYLLGVFALLLLVFMLLEKMVCKMQGVRILSLLMVSAVFFIQARVYTKNDLRSSMSEDEEAAAWLAQQDYTAGYATFWRANLLAELGNGQYEMYVYQDWTDGELYPWLQSKDHLESYPDGPVFVYIDDYEYLGTYGETPACAQEERLVWVSESGGRRIYEYESAEEIDAIQKARRAAYEARINGSQPAQ